MAGSFFWRSLRGERGSGDGSAFSFTGDDRAVLCLHGFSGTPFEVRPLGRALADRGFSALGPVLAGHGQDHDAFARSTAEEWLASAEAGLLQLCANHPTGRIGVIGFSMGGLLAIRLCARHPERVLAVALLSVPLRLRKLERRAIQALARFLPAALTTSRLLRVPKLTGSDVTDPVVRDQNPGLPSMPVAALGQLLQLQTAARAELPSLALPALVAHGLRDRTVPLSDSLELAGTIGSASLERLWLQKSGHLIGVDVERAILQGALVKFFERHLDGPAARPDTAAGS